MTAPVTLTAGLLDTLSTLARLGRSDGPLEPIAGLRDAMVDLTREDGLLAQTNAGLERLSAPGSGLDSLTSLTESLAGLAALQETLERIAEVAENLDRLAATTEELEVALAPISRLAGRVPGRRRAAREVDPQPERELPAPPSGP